MKKIWIGVVVYIFGKMISGMVGEDGLLFMLFGMLRIG